jgi:hypothetical protein
MISRRNLEAATAALTGAFGAAVVLSSIENGIGWSSAGVDAGTFPFITGLVIVGGSLFNLMQGSLQNRELMLGRGELERLGALFIPAAIYVGVIPLIGMYLASAAYVFGTFAFQNRVSRVRSLIAALVVMVSLYLLFERMFQVSLPRGLLGDASGF